MGTLTGRLGGDESARPGSQPCTPTLQSRLVGLGGHGASPTDPYMFPGLPVLMANNPPNGQNTAVVLCGFRTAEGTASPNRGWSLFLVFQPDCDHTVSRAPSLLPPRPTDILAPGRGLRGCARPHSKHAQTQRVYGRDAQYRKHLQRDTPLQSPPLSLALHRWAEGTSPGTETCLLPSRRES